MVMNLIPLHFGVLIEFMKFFTQDKRGKKYINPNIEKYITPLALAVLIMDDGGYAKPGVRIATNSFKLEEVELLANIIKNKFDLDCTVQHVKAINKYSIYIKGVSIPTLINVVLPHFHPSMYYKPRIINQDYKLGLIINQGYKFSIFSVYVYLYKVFKLF